MRKKIAIVGGGLSGLVCGYLLSKKYDVSLYEEKAYLGGHSYTHLVTEHDRIVTIDMGFLLFNKQGYPRLTEFFHSLGVPLPDCSLSFSYYSPNLISYKSKQLGNPFGPKSNLLDRKSYQLYSEIKRFNTLARQYQPSEPELNITEYLKNEAFTELFMKAYFFPIMNVLWSLSAAQLDILPSGFIFDYLRKHGLLETFYKPNWIFLKGGANTYVSQLTQPYENSIHLETKIKMIHRDKDAIIIETDFGEAQYDILVLAVQADQALALMQNPSPLERHILNSFNYSHRNVFLHTDASIMPPKPSLWAGLNYKEGTPPMMTYHANKVQALNAEKDYYITLSEGNPVAPDKIIIERAFRRPLFTNDSIQMQKRYNEINGLLNTYYCGAYWGYGTHEDAIHSALNACQAIENDH